MGTHPGGGNELPEVDHFTVDELNERLLSDETASGFGPRIVEVTVPHASHLLRVANAEKKYRRQCKRLHS